jgi:hypothetical protein
MTKIADHLLLEPVEKELQNDQSDDTDHDCLVDHLSSLRRHTLLSMRSTAAFWDAKPLCGFTSRMDW